MINLNHLIFPYSLACFVLFPGQSRGGAGGHTSGDGAVQEPATGHGETSAEERDSPKQAD